MRQYLIDLLKCLEAAIPPPANCHHAITFAQFGSDETEWEDRLALQINRGGIFHCIFLDDDDLQCFPDYVAAHVVKLLAQDMPNAQLGVGLGKYLP